MAQTSQTEFPKYELKFDVLHFWKFQNFFEMRKRMARGVLIHDNIELPLVGQSLRVIMLPRGSLTFDVLLEYDGDLSLKIIDPLVLFCYNNESYEAAPKMRKNELLLAKDNTICRYDWMKVTAVKQEVRAATDYHANANEEDACPAGGLVVQIAFSLEQKLTNNNSQVSSMMGLSSDLQQMYEDRDSADFSLQCDDQTLKCHSFILAARSDVFKQMFSHTDFAEMQNREIKIQDADVETLEALIQFLYTDRLGPEVKTTEGLLTLADKYNIQTLRLKCENHLMNNIRVNNALRYFRLASDSNSSNLKKRVLEMIKGNLKTILKSREWLDMKEDPNVLAFYDEILSFIAESK